MKRYLCLIVAVSALASCAGGSRNNARKEPVREQICGGYSNPQTPTDEELDMFHSLSAGETTELVPISVSHQIVNGTNYKFLCAFRDSTGQQGNCFVIIYKPINGEPVVKGLELTD